MRRNYGMKTAAALLASALFLTGCGSKMPDLSSEQAMEVGEYAAVMLLKYDAGNRSRLVDLSTVEETPKKQPADGELETEQIQEETMEETAPEETPVVQAPVAGAEEMISSMEQFYGFPEGITIAYQGASICQSYPEGEEEAVYFVLDATPGNSLLVLEFQIVNQSGEAVDIDCLQENIIYRVTVNDSTARNALITMLANDLSTFAGTIPAGESANVVLIAEMREENLGEITSLSLRLKSEAKTYTIQLQ